VSEIKQAWVEHPIYIKDLKVRGYIDLVIEDTDGKIFVYDIKTMNNWAWRYKFGRKKSKGEASIHQELQLATYGLACKDEFGRIDGLFLIFYNKDTSVLKTVEISKDRLLSTISYWNKIKELHIALPILKKNESPIYDWECKYCNFNTQCKKDEGIE